MKERLKVKEKYSGKWKIVLFTSMIGAAVTFGLYLYIESILWSGIFRLVAFMSLTIGIFCMLKVMEGAKTCELEISDGFLTITYLKNNEAIGTDKFAVDDINSIYREPFQITTPFTSFTFDLPQNSSYKVEFKNDKANDTPLFKFGGRILTIDNSSGEKLEQFLSTYELLS